MDYREDDYLLLSGLQHFSFCRRQWALIHIEGQWSENLRTTQGELLHERCHDGDIAEKRGSLLTVRALPVHSARLGISGSCDVVEFHQTPDGTPLVGREGLWQPFPIEYKRGQPKEHEADVLQLCAQAICLEEMLCCEIPKGAIFYGESRRRLLVDVGDDLREKVTALCHEMHQYAQRGYTPSAKPGKFCNACSLKNICLPKLLKKQSVAAYLRDACGEGGGDECTSY